MPGSSTGYDESLPRMTRIAHWVAGRRVPGESGRTAPVYDPALGVQTSEVALASPAEVDAAVKVAVGASREWGASSLTRRAGLMFRFRELLDGARDELAAIVTREHGKVLDDARGEVARGLENVEFACGIPNLMKGWSNSEVSTGIDIRTVLEPLGVVAGISPFNFPVMVPLWMMANAVACGNCFVLKPSEKDPSASLLVAELVQQAGFPDGVDQVGQLVPVVLEPERGIQIAPEVLRGQLAQCGELLRCVLRHLVIQRFEDERDPSHSALDRDDLQLRMPVEHSREDHVGHHAGVPDEEERAPDRKFRVLGMRLPRVLPEEGHRRHAGADVEMDRQLQVRADLPERVPRAVRQVRRSEVLGIRGHVHASRAQSGHAARLADTSVDVPGRHQGQRKEAVARVRLDLRHSVVVDLYGESA